MVTRVDTGPAPLAGTTTAAAATPSTFPHSTTALATRQTCGTAAVGGAETSYATDVGADPTFHSSHITTAASILSMAFTAEADARTAGDVGLALACDSDGGKP